MNRKENLCQVIGQTLFRILEKDTDCPNILDEAKKTPVLVKHRGQQYVVMRKESYLQFLEENNK